MAMRHVRSGREIVAAQRLRVASLHNMGLDTREAERLLIVFEGALAIFEQDLEELERKNLS